MAFFTSYQYKRLDEKSTTESPDDQSQTSNAKYDFRTIAVLLAMSTFIVAFTISAFAYNRCLACTTTPTSQRLEASYRPCGRNHTEASEAGCVYDVMMNSWLPRDCYDEDLSASFWNLRDWSFYADMEGMHRLNVEELSQRTQAHATLEYHFAHCIYSLRKVQRAIAQGRYIEEDVASEKHDHHCSSILQRGLKEMESEFSLNDIRTTLNIAYPRCVSAGELLEPK